MNQFLESRFPSAEVDLDQAKKYLEDLLEGHTITMKYLHAEYTKMDVFLSYRLEICLRDGTVFEDIVPFGHYDIREPRVAVTLIDRFSLMDHIDRILHDWVVNRPC